MASIPSTIKAVVVQPDKTVQFTDFPGPKLNDEDDIIVKNYSCAQNPTDGKGIAMGRTKPGRVTGCDFMGKVAAIGSNVKNVKVGDRVRSQLSNWNCLLIVARWLRFLWARFSRTERGVGQSTALFPPVEQSEFPIRSPTMKRRQSPSQD
jgi:NADPH:quinone reductase-like Zn-dependent oxidoreductase